MTTPPAEPVTTSLDDVTAQTLSTYTGGKIPPEDPRLDLLIRGAVQGIRRHCGWHISPERAETLIRDGKGGNVQRVLSLNVVSVQSVVDAGQSLVDRQDYTWSEAGLFKRRRGRWSSDYRDVTISLTHGYADVPDLVSVVHAVVSRALSSPMGATREQAGALSVSWATTSPGVSGGLALLAHEISIVDTYKVH